MVSNWLPRPAMGARKPSAGQHRPPLRRRLNPKARDWPTRSAWASSSCHWAGRFAPDSLARPPCKFTESGLGEVAVHRISPRSEQCEEDQRRDDGEILEEVRLIGRPRRTVHGPECVNKDNREHDEHNQNDRGPTSLIADENENAAEQIDGPDQIGEHRRRQDTAGY